MKPIRTRLIMKWMERLRIPLHRRYEIIDFGGFSCFMLTVLLSILIQDLPFTGIAAKAVMIPAIVLYAALLGLSGYFFYISCSLWIPLLIFGVLDLVMAFAIDAGSSFTVMMSICSAVLIPLGLFLMPRQLRGRKIFSREAREAQDTWNISRQPIRPSGQTDPAAENRPPESTERTFARIRAELAELQRAEAASPKDTPASFTERITALKKELGEALLTLPSIHILCADLSTVHPLYVSSAGYFEVFTDIRFAEIGQKKLTDTFGLSFLIRTCSGSESISAFFTTCANDGHSSFRLDNGGRDVCELNLSDFFPYRAAHLPDEKNRALRHLLGRARLYREMALRQPKDSPAFRSLHEIKLTMQFNAYRLLGQGAVYVLGCAMPQDAVYTTRAALEKTEQWKKELPEGQSFPDEYTVFTEKLNMHYVNRPGETGSPEKGMLCAFTDLSSARSAQKLFRQSGMDCCVLLATWDHIFLQARQCAGIVIDMQTVNFEIPAADYTQVNNLRTLDAPIMVRFKDNSASETPPPPPSSSAPVRRAVLRDTQIKDAWKQFSYQWPHRFGWDYMVHAAQYLCENDLILKTLVTAPMLSGNETEHIHRLPECAHRIEECLKQECSVLAIGGFSKTGGCLLKIYWFNQTDVVRIFTAGDIAEEKVQALTDLLCAAEESGFHTS